MFGRRLAAAILAASKVVLGERNVAGFCLPPDRFAEPGGPAQRAEIMIPNLLLHKWRRRFLDRVVRSHWTKVLGPL